MSMLKSYPDSIVGGAGQMSIPIWGIFYGNIKCMTIR
jgi:hypothetical protein